MYQIVAANIIVPMSITLKIPETDTAYRLRVSVDYTSKSVYFDDMTEKLNYEQLEQDILEHLRPTDVQQFVLSPDILDRINKVRNGTYQTNYVPY